MKAIAYNIKSEEKECLILANYKKHDITIIANSLCMETLSFAHGKEVLIVFNEDPIDKELVNGLKQIGIKYIANSSFDISHIDIDAVMSEGLKLANVPFSDTESNIMSRMKQVITNLDNWAANKCLGDACCNNTPCEKIVYQQVKLC